MSDIEDNSNEKEELIEQTLEKVEAYEDVMNEDDSLLEGSANDTCANNQPFGKSVSVGEDKKHPWNRHVWYYKIESQSSVQNSCQIVISRRHSLM
eukprot:6913584-Ditylum_brightwellii.AAC.1